MKKWLFPLGATIAAGFTLGIISEGRDSAISSLRKEQRGDEYQPTASRAPDQSAHSELVGAALGALTGPPDLQGLARLGEVLPLLGEDAIRDLLDRLERSSPGSPSPQLELLFSWLLTHKKVVATDWITTRLVAVAQDGPGGPLYRGDGLGKMALAWAQADPEGAVAFARVYPHLGISEQLLTAAVHKVAEQDGSRGVAALLELPAGRARTGALASVFTDWAKRDSPAAFVSASRLEAGEARDRSIGAVLGEWAKTDAAAALESYHSAGMNDAGVLATVLASLGEQNPTVAVAALEGLPPNDFLRCSPRVAVEWARQDPAAALTWVMERGLSLGKMVEVELGVEHYSARRMFSTKERMISSPLRSAFEAQPDATLAWLRHLPPGGVRDEVYELAASSVGNADVALELFAQLRPEASARAAFDIGKRFGGNSAVTQQWIDSLPPGPVRQQAFAGFGASGAIREPSRVEDRDAWLSGRIQSMHYLPALKETIKISDPTLRKDVFYEIFKSVRGTTEARNRIIDTLMDEAGLSEDWKRRLTD